MAGQGYQAVLGLRVTSQVAGQQGDEWIPRGPGCVPGESSKQLLAVSAKTLPAMQSRAE
jgi:hypothetical protein